MLEDKKTLGLTEKNKATMEQVVESVGFGHDMDAAKFAFALAISRGEEPTQIEGIGTIWNVGSFDEDGDLKALIENLYPNAKTPYRTLETLMNIGFRLLAEELQADRTIRIEELLQKEMAS